LLDSLPAAGIGSLAAQRGPDGWRRRRFTRCFW
jgi:hypothetical protein